MLLYGVIDAAQDARLHDLVQACTTQACLFTGTLSPAMAQAAPYLVGLPDDAPLFRTWRAEGRGHNWGILCRSSQPLDRLRRHFQQKLQVKLPDGQVVMFRFYDPRVFAAYLPTCTADELTSWFAMVDVFYAEIDDGRAVRSYRLEGGALTTADAPQR